MQWTDINWNPAKAILPYLLTGDAFITVSWHKSPRPGSGSTRRPLQSKQTALFMISYVLRSKINQQASQTSWRYNNTFTTADKCVFLSLPEQRKIDRGGWILYGIQRKVEGNDSGLHTSTFNGAVTVKHYKGSYDDSSGATSQRIEALQYPFPRVMSQAINTEGVGS